MAPASSKAARKLTKSQRTTTAAQATVARPNLFDAVTRPWILASVLAVLTIAVYAPVNHHPFFTLDDDGYVVNNKHLQNGSALETIGWALTSYDLANWHPVTWLSHAVDVRLFGPDPSGQHDVNLLLHAANALLLFWILLAATGYRGRSFMVAALFALHPVNVESVAWIAERKNVLSLFFFLLALGAYRWYAMKPRAGRYSLVAVLYALGLMAKPQVITLPFILLLWDYWPLGRMFARHSTASTRAGKNNVIPPQKFSWLLLEKLPLLALSIGSAILTMRAQGFAGAMRYYPLSVRMGNAIVAYTRYIGTALWPSRLSVFYPHPELRPATVGAALFLLIAITAVVMYCRRQRYLAVGWLWFLGTLVPMIGLVQVGEQAMADRYAYLSFIGLFLMICWGVSDLAEQRHLSPALLAVPSVLVVLVLTVITYRQLSYWGDNVTLWSRMLAISPGTYEVEENLGVALLEGGQPQQAMAHFQRVTALVPASAADMGRELAGYAAVAHLYLGAYDQQHGQEADAIAHYKDVLGLAQDFAARNVYAHLPPVLTSIKAAALGNMGDAYYASGNFADARTSYEAALQLEPASARHWIGLGVVEMKSGDAAAAAQAFSHAARIQPVDVTFLLLARALEQSGHLAEAEAARKQATLISQNLAAAEQTVGKLLAQ